MSTATMAPTTQSETRQRPWWLTLITGISALIVGGVMLWGNLNTKVDTYMLLVTFLGIYWLVEGIFDIISLFVDHSMWGWKLFIGIVSILAGSSILMYPVAAAVSLPKIFALVLGIWGLMYGIILLIMAFRGGGWGAGIMGVLGIIFGIALMMNYYVIGMGLSMVWAASVTAVLGGILLIVQAFRQKSA
jgi:uncharacterized membrane protein HdeD (DUF308 family)